MPLTKKQKILILERQGMACANCGRKITLGAHTLREWKEALGYYPDKSVPSQAKMHHKRWRAFSGSDNLSNVVGLCGRCHAKTHNYYRGYNR